MLQSRSSRRPNGHATADRGRTRIDPTTLEMLGGRSGCRRSANIVVMTARPTFHAWQPGESLVTLAVRDLPADTEAMVRTHRGKRLPAQVLLLLKSDGNPLFVEEMTRMLRNPLAGRRDDEFVLTGPMRSVRCPRGCRICCALDRLEPGRLAAARPVVGRDHVRPAGRSAPAEGQTIRRGLQQLLDGLVFATGNRFTIKHELIKDAARIVLRRTRQRYHERVARRSRHSPPLAQGQPERWPSTGRAGAMRGCMLGRPAKGGGLIAVEEAASHPVTDWSCSRISRCRSIATSSSSTCCPLTALTIRRLGCAQVADVFTRSCTQRARGDSPRCSGACGAFYL
jgi:hypothetical protein